MSDAYYKGLEAKMLEIQQMGWMAARDKFNLDYPIGWQAASNDAREYSIGEFAALCNKAP